MLYLIYNKIIIGENEFQPILAQLIYFAGLNHSFTTPSNEKKPFKTASLRQSQYRVNGANFSSCKVQIYFKNIYLNLLLMHAQVAQNHDPFRLACTKVSCTGTGKCAGHTGNTSLNPRKSLTAFETTNERCEQRKANLSG